MKSYFTIFFTLVMPVSILFTAIATVYFSMNLDFTKAVKLGILVGVLSGISFSLLMALFILIVRIVNNYKRNKTTFTSPYEEIKTPVTLNPTLYEKKHQSSQENLIQNTTRQVNTIEEKIMLLMDKSMAFEVSINAINNLKVVDIIQQNKNEGFVLLQSKEEVIKIKISTLTRHTAQMLISSSLNKNNIKNIITILKEKEHSFLQY